MNFLKKIPIIGDILGGGDRGDGGAAAAAAASRDHEKSMQNARLEHQRMQDEANKRHELNLEKERTRRQDRAAEIASAARAQEAEITKALQKQKDDTTKELERLSNEDKQKQREHQEAESKRQKEHEVHLQKLEEEKVRIKEAGERAKEAHKKAMKDMWINAKVNDRANREKQRDDALERVKAAIDDIDKENKVARDQLVIIKKEHEELIQDISNQDRVIHHWAKYKKDKLEIQQNEMDKAWKEWQFNENEINRAIETTGVHEDNICRFLKLTHALIGETTQAQVNANTLDARLNTFCIMLERQCQDKLTIDTLFAAHRLQRFVPILATENYHECDDLQCDDEEEFKEDVLAVCKMEINKQIKAWQQRHPDDVDPFDAFLTKYGLMRYKTGLQEAGLDSLESADDIENEEDINDLIKEAHISGLFKKKLKRAINDLKTHKYAPPQPSKELVKSKKNGDDNDDEDEKQVGHEDVKPRPISKQEEKKLRRLCCKPEIWQNEQEKKILYTKLALLEQTPILGRFFNKIHNVIEDAQKLITYNINDKLNEEQKNAMAALMDNVKPKSIELPKGDGDGEDDDDDDKAPDDKDTDMEPSNLPDFEQRKAWQQGSEVQVYSKGNDKWYNGMIINIFDDKEGEWLEIKYETGKDKRTKQVDRYGPDIRDPVSVECRAITAAITVDINVVAMMRDEFEINSKTRDCLQTAHGVERSAKAILLCQSQMRQSMKLAASILKLKPSNMTKETKPLWIAVDKGIIHIIKTAIEMSKISEEYFGFFYRFNQSLQRFISMNESDQEMSLMLSLEFLKKDIRDFSAFKTTFNKNLAKLSDECMSVITKCVEQSKGIEAFNKAKIERQRTKEVYLEKKEDFDAKSDELAAELESKCDKRAKDKAEAAKLELQWKTLDKVIKDNEAYKEQYTQRKLKLNDLNFETFEDVNDDPMPAESKENQEKGVEQDPGDDNKANPDKK